MLWRINGSLVHCKFTENKAMQHYCLGRASLQIGGFVTVCYRSLGYRHYINTLCLSYISLSFVHKGVHLDPTIFEYFSVRKKKHISTKKNNQKGFVSKWQTKNEFSLHENSHVFKIWRKKKHFPRGICQQTLAQSWKAWIHLHLEIKIFCFKMAAKKVLWYCAVMLIYAN